MKEYEWKTHNPSQRKSEKPFVSVLYGSLYVSAGMKEILGCGKFSVNGKYKIFIDEKKKAIRLLQDESGYAFHGGYAGISLHRKIPRGRYYLTDKDKLIFNYENKTRVTSRI